MSDLFHGLLVRHLLSDVISLVLPPNPDGTFPFNLPTIVEESDDSDVDDRFVLHLRIA